MEIEKILNEFGIYDIFDFLNYFFYCYDDYELRDLEEVKYDERVIVEGKVYLEFFFIYYGKKRNRLIFRVFVGYYLIIVVCFNCFYLKKKFFLGFVVMVFGKWDKYC